jgi:hypothetical protein
MSKPTDEDCQQDIFEDHRLLPPELQQQPTSHKTDDEPHMSPSFQEANCAGLRWAA